MLDKNFQLVTANKSVIVVEGNKVTRTSGTNGITKVVTESPKRGELVEFGACFCFAEVPVTPSGEIAIKDEQWGEFVDQTTVEPNVVKLGKCVYFKYATGFTYVCTRVVSTNFPDANA